MIFPEFERTMPVVPGRCSGDGQARTLFDVIVVGSVAVGGWRGPPTLRAATAPLMTHRLPAEAEFEVDQIWCMKIVRWFGVRQFAAAFRQASLLDANYGGYLA